MESNHFFLPHNINLFHTIYTVKNNFYHISKDFYVKDSNLLGGLSILGLSFLMYHVLTMYLLCCILSKNNDQSKKYSNKDDIGGSAYNNERNC